MDSARVQIRLNSWMEALELIQQLSSLEDSFSIESRSGTRRVNAKSVLGVLYTMHQYGDGLYLVNNTHAGMIPNCVEPFLYAGA